MEKHQSNPPPIKIPRLRREAQKKEDNIKILKKLINIGMIGNQKSIGIRLSGLFQEVVMLRKIIFVHITTCFI